MIEFSNPAARASPRILPDRFRIWRVGLQVMFSALAIVSGIVWRVCRALAPAPLPVLAITANLGSLFEKFEELQEGWASEIIKMIQTRSPHFVALHIQELGGKNFARDMHLVHDFVRRLGELTAPLGFKTLLHVLDQNFDNLPSFTALGAIYFIHKDATSIRLRSFNGGETLDCTALTGIRSIPEGYFHKARFAAASVGTKANRKGFILTRWQLHGRDIDLVDTHLFHDASNVVAAETVPSVYASDRHQALLTVLKTLDESSKGRPIPAFIFGDMNFRLTLPKVYDHVLGQDPHIERREEVYEGRPVVRLTHSLSRQDILRVNDNSFLHQDPEQFLEDRGEAYRPFDNEVSAFQSVLFELPIKFEPSYPYQESAQFPRSFLNKRCPAWCDRVLMTESAFALVRQSDAPKYDLVGRDVCMGDHKPVCLYFELPRGSPDRPST
eukprot:m.832529 g.832529  ORF g.832529 m.832529 type:complete len:441 (+) comp59464_c0_seq4:388-1710(+)